MTIKQVNTFLARYGLGCVWEKNHRYLWFFSTESDTLEIPDSVYGYPTFGSIPSYVFTDAIKGYKEIE